MSLNPASSDRESSTACVLLTLHHDVQICTTLCLCVGTHVCVVYVTCMCTGMHTGAEENVRHSTLSLVLFLKTRSFPEPGALWFCLFVWAIQQAPIILLFAHPPSQSLDHKCLCQHPAPYAVTEDLNAGLYPCEASTLTLQSHLVSLQRKLHFNVLHIQSSVSPTGFPSLPQKFLIDFFLMENRNRCF